MMATKDTRLFHNLEALTGPRREPSVIDYAPPAVRAAAAVPMPAYVEHRDGVDDVGRLTAEAVVRQYEEAAKEVEAMGAELKERLKKLDATKDDAVRAMEEIKETAAAYRDAGKRVFLDIEDCSLMNAEVRKTCAELKDKIVRPVVQN
jgi:hypothetical protein